MPAGEVEATARLLLTGFDRVTPAQQSLIDAFRERGHAVEMAEADEVSPAEKVSLVEAVDQRDEIATSALWVQRALAAAAAQGQTPRIAVVVPKVSNVRPEIERIFRQILAPEAVAIESSEPALPFEFSLGVPLADVPMVRSALFLLRWMDQAMPQDQISWLLLSGFICEHNDELLPAAELDARLRRQPMRQPEQELETFLRFLSEGWREAKPLEALRHRLRASRRLLPQSRSLNFSEWVGAAEQILEAAHWPGAHQLQSEDFQVQARWSQLLDSVAALAFDGRKVDYAEFLEVLVRQAEQTIFAPESRDAPVQVLRTAGGSRAHVRRAMVSRRRRRQLAGGGTASPVSYPSPAAPAWHAARGQHSRLEAGATGNHASREQRRAMHLQLRVAERRGGLPAVDAGDLWDRKATSNRTSRVDRRG